MSLNGAIALTRFGMGASPEEIASVSASPKSWLLGQLNSKNAQSFDTQGLKPSSEIFKLARAYRQDKKNLTGMAAQNANKDYSQAIRRNFQQEILRREAHATKTAAHFHERLTRFWSNHFSVSNRNRQTRLFVGAYDREAIRPFIMGNFQDLAERAILHPAMLSFLDNYNSIGPNSKAGLRRERGLNENLAREVLELHTVTPAAGYSQADVTEFAKALTGWTIGRREREPDKIGKTVFEGRAHEPGTRKVLGQLYSQKGGKQALKILSELCLRPETAQNIALKLARHFHSDTPPDSLISALKNRFMKTGGDLKEVYKTLIHAPEMWDAPLRKVKTPQELIISTGRMIGLERVFPRRSRDSYESLAQMPFSAPTPEGWPDNADAWLGPDSMMKRIEWANELAGRLPSMDARVFLKSALGARLSEDTLRSVLRAESGQQAIVLALMSPEFQRR
jgi:uncharacterized protein (DUF1800 family)